MIQNEDGWIANKDALTINEDTSDKMNSALGLTIGTIGLFVSSAILAIIGYVDTVANTVKDFSTTVNMDDDQKWKKYAGTYYSTVALYERDTAMGTMSYVVRWTSSTNSAQASLEIFPIEGFVSDEYLEGLAVVTF